MIKGSAARVGGEPPEQEPTALIAELQDQLDSLPRLLQRDPRATGKADGVRDVTVDDRFRDRQRHEGAGRSHGVGATLTS